MNGISKKKKKLKVQGLGCNRMWLLPSSFVA
jgi:hypothetical protein